MSHPPRFHVTDSPLTLGVVQLPEEEARHAAGVLRLRDGDAVELFDGAGTVAEGRVIDLSRRSVSIAVESACRVEPERPILTIGTAIPKGKRWQMLVEKCTELGVSAIHPIRFERSVVEGQGDAGKWRRWAVEASKQSRRAYVPVVEAPVTLACFLERVVAGPCLLCAPEGDSLVKWGGQIDRAEEVAFVVGPEGGLTEEETRCCFDASYAPVRLGARILRVETACMAACALARALM